MNIIVNDRTDFAHLAVVLAAMMAISRRPVALGQATGMVVVRCHAAGSSAVG